MSWQEINNNNNNNINNSNNQEKKIPEKINEIPPNNPQPKIDVIVE